MGRGRTGVPLTPGPFALALYLVCCMCSATDCCFFFVRSACATHAVLLLKPLLDSNIQTTSSSSCSCIMFCLSFSLPDSPILPVRVSFSYPSFLFSWTQKLLLTICVRLVCDYSGQNPTDSIAAFMQCERRERKGDNKGRTDWRRRGMRMRRGSKASRISCPACVLSHGLGYKGRRERFEPLDLLFFLCSRCIFATDVTL